MGVTNFPDGLNIGSSAGAAGTFQIGGTAVTATASDLNAVAPIVGGTAVAADGAYAIDFGSQAVTGGTSIATGLSGTVQAVIVTLRHNTGTHAGAGDAFVAMGEPTGGAGSITLTCFDDDAGTATTAGTVDWIAFGTALA